MKFITDLSSQTTAKPLIAKLMGLPRDPTERGANCSPPPFGRVTAYGLPVPDPGGSGALGTRALVLPVFDEVDKALKDDAAGPKRLTVSENTTLTTIVSAARVDAQVIK